MRSTTDILFRSTLKDDEGECFSLSRIYGQLRKKHGISSQDEGYRRLRPWLAFRNLDGLEKKGSHIITRCQSTAEKYTKLLLDWLQPDNRPCHSQSELLNALYARCPQSPTDVELTAALRKLNSDFANSWLPKDVELVADSEIVGYAKARSLLPWRWLALILHGSIYAHLSDTQSTSGVRPAVVPQ